MADEKKQVPGHAPGCDGNCGEMHDKASTLAGVDNALNVLREQQKLTLTPDATSVLDNARASLKNIADDATIPDDDKTVFLMQGIFVCAVRLAGMLAATQTRRPEGSGGVPIPAGKLN